MKNEAVSADYLKSIWQFFASLRLTILVLLSLAVTSIIGTLIPQNQDPAEYFRAFGPFLYQILNVLDVFDMYHSWWFQLLLLLLTANVLICSIDRLSVTWKIVFPKNPRFSVARSRNRKMRREFDAVAAPDRLAESCQRLLAKRFRHTDRENTGAGIALFGEKRRWSRLGVYIVHSSVLLLLIGGLVGSIFGFEGFVNIPEGETVDTIRLRNSGEIHRLDFAIRCEDFSISFYETGQPKEYRSRLALIENGQVVAEKDIIVNDPLRYGGINIFQSSYGEMASPLPQTGPAPETVVLDFASRESGMAYQKTLKPGETVDIPEAGGTFRWKRYEPAARFMGQPIGEAIIGEMTPVSGPAEEVTLPLRFPNFDKMRKGAFIITILDRQPDAAAAPDPTGKRYFTGLQVTRDPGVWIVYTGFVLMILGCYVTFFMSHQQVYVELTPSGGGTRVLLTGTANRNRPGMETRLDAISRKLAETV